MVNSQICITRSPIVLSAATNATGSTYFDTWVNGEPCDYADVVFSLPAAQATNSSATYTSLVIGHAATTDISNATTFGTRGAGTTNSTATTAQFVLERTNDTAARSGQRVGIHLANAERYVHITFQAATNYNTSVFYCVLSRAGLPQTNVTNVASV